MQYNLGFVPKKVRIKMKKIIIVNNNLKTGGVQISLLNLLNEIHDLYDITLLLFNVEAKDYNLIPKKVKIISTNSPFKFLGVSSTDVSNSFILWFKRTFWAGLTKIFGRNITIKFMSYFQPILEGDYDYAISYLHEGPQKSFYGGCNEFVLRKIRAKKKIAWIHCDFDLCGANNKYSKKLYEQFDSIVTCSDGAMKVFLKCNPEFESKCIAVRNCNDYDRIRNLAGNGVKYDKYSFNIVTVCRLAQEKGLNRALVAIKYCVTKGCNLRYHIIGDGYQADSLKNMAKEFGLSNIVTFYGNQSNPYPYIKSADLFLLPSYHEAAPMVFDEAACLGVPVLATETTSTYEMITKNKSGFVCKNSQESLNDALYSILCNPAVLNPVREALSVKEFSNLSNIELLKNKVLI